MRIICPGCDNAFAVPNRDIAGTINCPRCGAVALAMPDSHIDYPSGADMPLGEDMAEYLPRPTRLAPIVLGGTFIIVLALIGAGVYIWSNEAKKNPPVKRVDAQSRPAAVAPREREREITQDERILKGLVEFSFLMQITGCLFLIAWLVAWVFASVWVARDSRRRLGDSGGIWVVVLVLTGLVGLWPIGLLVYVASRPSGPLLPCSNCGMDRLAFSKVCPHCADRNA